MKIIEKGVLPEEKPYRHICYNCKTHFEFLRKEATVESDYRNGSYLKINCPLCGKASFIDAD